MTLYLYAICDSIDKLKGFEYDPKRWKRWGSVVSWLLAVGCWLHFVVCWL